MTTRPAWTRLPPRRILEVIIDGRGRVLSLECGHRWSTRRAYVVGQRLRCVMCSDRWTAPTV